MFKDVKKVSAILAEKEKDQRAEIEKAEKDLADTLNQLAELKASLEKASTPEEYKTVLHDIRDTEAVQAFCENRVTIAMESVLSNEEYNEIVSEVGATFSDVLDYYSKLIFPEVDKLIKIMDDYEKDVAELNTVLSDAGRLKDVAPALLQTRKIIPDPTQGFNKRRFFIEAYYSMLTSKYMIDKIGVKI